jgi:hypothetical protein
MLIVGCQQQILMLTQQIQVMLVIVKPLGVHLLLRDVLFVVAEVAEVEVEVAESATKLVQDYLVEQIFVVGYISAEIGVMLVVLPRL